MPERDTKRLSQSRILRLRLCMLNTLPSVVRRMGASATVTADLPCGTVRLLILVGYRKMREWPLS